MKEYYLKKLTKKDFVNKIVSAVLVGLGLLTILVGQVVEMFYQLDKYGHWTDSVKQSKIAVILVFVGVVIVILSIVYRFIYRAVIKRAIDTINKEQKN